MNIGFDAKRLFNNFTGLGNYSRFIVAALSEKFPDNTYHLFTPRVRQNKEANHFLQQKNIRTLLPPAWVAAVGGASLWRTYFLGKESRNRGIQLFHGLSNELPQDIGKTRSIVTIHDLIFLRYPELYNRIDTAIYTAKVKHAVKVASKIVAISHQTASDVVELLKVDPSRIEVVYQGCHTNFNRAISEAELAQVRNQYNLPQEFILNVGTIEPRKNALTIVQALQQLGSRADIPLVLVGRPTKYLSRIREYARRHKLQDRLICLHTVKFEDLPAIYRLAKVFVYPSVYEGFGIPLVEAISCGVPVITSTGSCFREAAGPSSIYVDPANPEELAPQLLKVLTEASLVKKMTEESSIYIKQFDAPEVAVNMMNVYREVLN